MSEVDAQVAPVRLLYRDPASAFFKEGNPHVHPPITISQGSIFRKISDLSQEPNSRAAFLVGLQAVRAKELELTLPQLFLLYGVVSEFEAIHLRDHWFNNDTGWWPKLNAGPIMGEGLIRGFTSAQTSGVPLDFFWLIYDVYDDPKPGRGENSIFVRVVENLGPQSATSPDALPRPSSILCTFCTPARPQWMAS